MRKLAIIPSLIIIILLIVSLWILEIGLLGFFVLASIIDFIWRYKIAGNITMTELQQIHGRERVALTDVTGIAGRFWRNAFIPNDVILDIYTSNHCISIAVNEREVLKLFRMGFSNWIIGTALFFRSNTNLFITRPNSPDTPKRIIYEEIGKYAISPDAILFMIIFIVLGSSVVYSFGLINVWFLLGLLLSSYLFLVPSYIAPIEVTLDERGITIKNEDGTKFLPFDEITIVKKGFYRIIVTTRSGERFYFPKACYMLAEFITEFRKSPSFRNT